MRVKCWLTTSPWNLNSTKDAISHGIGMVHQHFMLIPVFSVTENIMLGSETDHRTAARDLFPRWTGWNAKRSRRWFGNSPINTGWMSTPKRIVGDLPVGVQQRVEIVKALYRKASILILDEPTAVLTPQEAEDLTRIMHELTKQGVSIIFITHKLKEVLAIADRITVMRAGKVVGTTTPAETSEHQLAAMMVGREVILTVDKGPAQPKEDILKVENLVVHDRRGLEAVRDVSFNVREGEILGIAGVQGNGQTELVEALTGLIQAQSGHILMSGKDLTNHTPRDFTMTGLAHIPEDRQRHGLVMGYSVVDNMVLCDYYHAPYSNTRRSPAASP